jgi:hypothetical protein
MRIVNATRYVTPLREGGSLPGLVEADDDGLYVLKFRAAGQGMKALTAELIAGELARALGLPVPEIVLVQLDPVLGLAEPDPEIQDLIRGSGGINLAMDYLPGSLAFTASDIDRVDAGLASLIVWFDSFVLNVDRTIRNTNMLLWHGLLHLIDHGASLYFHHQWPSYRDYIASPFAFAREHVLLRVAGAVPEADAIARERIDAGAIDDILAQVPDEWLTQDPYLPSAAAYRDAYREFLLTRLDSSSIFVQEVANARSRLV